MNNQETIMPSSEEDETLTRKAEGDSTSETALLKQAVEEATNKAEENRNLFLRARADMENAHRRAGIDIDNARKFAIEKFARELLGVVDGLEQGLAVAETEGDAVYRTGMTLTLKLCLDTFDKFGIQRISPAIGGSFDHNRHEAISMQPSADFEPNKILVVAQAGFTLHDRVLRPARVVVSTVPIAPASA